MPVTHAKVSGRPDPGDTSMVRPSDWNAAHIGTTLEYVKVYRAGTIDVNHNTATDIPFTSAINDPNSYWDSSTKLIVPTGRGGNYLIWGNLFTYSQPYPQYTIKPVINGTEIEEGFATVIRASEQAGGYGTGWSASNPIIYNVSEGQDVRLRILTDTSGNGSYAMTFQQITLTIMRMSFG